MPMRTAMNADVEDRERVIIIHLSDMLIFQNVQDIESLWGLQLEKKQRTIAIDFERLITIDLNAISFLVKFVKSAIFRDREVLFYNINPTVHELLALAGLDKFFDILTKERFSERYLD